MLRWGIAGCGWVARDFVAPAIEASANGRLAAIFDLAPSALDAMAKLFSGSSSYTNIDAFLGAIDAVYVATPNHAHRPVVEAAARRGLPVLCEKPMAATLADARAMVAACEHARVLYATAFDQRFHPAHQHMARLVQSGALGQVTSIRIVYCCWVDAEFGRQEQGGNWRVDPARAGGGALMDLAPHGLDLSSVLLGETLAEVAAIGQSRVHGYSVEDGALLIARSASGVLVQLHVAYNCPEQFPRRRLEVVGTQAQLIATDTMGQTPGGVIEMISAGTGERQILEIPGGDRSPFLNQVEAFADAVLRGRPFAFSAAHDLHVMERVARAQAQIADVARAA